MRKCNCPAICIAACLVALITAPWSAAAPIVAPTFTATFTDARTDDNQFVGSGGKQRWTIDIGADSYQNEFYERPTIQGFAVDPLTGQYSVGQYYANIDITTARAGRDNQFFYVEINLVGNYFHKEDNSKDFEGLKYQYSFRFSTDPDGRFGYLMRGEFANPHSQPNWTPLKTVGARDTDGDVGGRGYLLGGPTGINVTKTDNSNEGNGLNGYNLDIISDGKLIGTSTEVLFIRMVGTSTVQLALDYGAIGLSAAYIDGLQYLDMQAIRGGGPNDPRNYFWNDKYTFVEAGSPYLSDFNNGIPNPQNVYELDTIRGGALPEPASLGLLALAALALRRRR